MAQGLRPTHADAPHGCQSARSCQSSSLRKSSPRQERKLPTQQQPEPKEPSCRRHQPVRQAGRRQPWRQENKCTAEKTQSKLVPGAAETVGQGSKVGDLWAGTSSVGSAQRFPVDAEGGEGSAWHSHAHCTFSSALFTCTLTWFSHGCLAALPGIHHRTPDQPWRCWTPLCLCQWQASSSSRPWSPLTSSSLPSPAHRVASPVCLRQSLLERECSAAYSARPHVTHFTAVGHALVRDRDGAAAASGSGAAAGDDADLVRDA